MKDRGLISIGIYYMYIEKVLIETGRAEPAAIRESKENTLSSRMHSHPVRQFLFGSHPVYLPEEFTT